jgi:subtilisin family serine protease
LYFNNLKKKNMMKTIIFGFLMLLLGQQAIAQKDFIYGEKGMKIYFHEADSIIQIKFRKNTSPDEQVRVVKSLNPEFNISDSKSNIFIIHIKKDKLHDLGNLTLDSIITYANKSLVFSDGALQFPTEKVLVKVKASIQVEKILTSLNIAWESVSRIGSDKNSFLIELKNGESVQVANLLYESGYFEYAQPSFTRLIKMMNEFYLNQWGLNNTGQNGGTAGIDINAPEAWAMTRGCNNIRVAVIDQGVDTDHPDLAGNLLPGFDATDGAVGGINGDCWGNDSHGTCCAGIIGATNNTIGIIGVSHNCRIIPIRVTYTFNGNQTWNDEWTVNAIHHAWEQDSADVLSCSWGGGAPALAVNAEITAALNQGRSNRGCVVVFATGNYNSAIIWPANSNTDIIAVGAMSPCGERKRSSSNYLEVNPGVTPDPLGVSCDNEKWWGSNYGNQLDIVAPGVLVPTTDIQGNAGYNTSIGIAGNYYQTYNGTSSATPHVAGVAALILSINSTLTQDQVRDIIESTCTKVGTYTYSTTAGRTNGKWNNEVGYGCVNAFAALQSVFPYLAEGVNVCTSGTTFTVNKVPTNSTVTWTCSSNITFDNQPGNPKVFTAIGTGYGSVTATINYTNCSPIVMQRTVWVGTPQIVTGSFSNLQYMGYSNYYKILTATGNYPYEGILSASADGGDGWSFYANIPKKISFTGMHQVLIRLMWLQKQPMQGRC